MVRKGYKQTEVGVIPEDWEVYEFGNVASVYRGGSPRPIQKYLTTNTNGINWIKIGDVKAGDKYINSTEEKIIPEGKYYSREVHYGDFILSNSMSFGRPYILNVDGCIHDGWLVIQDYSSTYIKEFLYYLLSSQQVMTQYISMAAGSSVKNLNKEKIANLQVLCPSKDEQTAIATALSDVDNLIENLEKLIEKKKKIKQGTMQELFSDKKHSIEWKTLLLNEIGIFKKGAGINRAQSQTGEIPAVRYGEIYTCHNYYIKKYYSKISQEIAEKSVKVTYGDILFTCSGETKEDIGKCVAIKDKLDIYAGGDLIIMTPNTELNPVFMGYLLNLPYVVRQKALKAQGDAIVHISLESIRNIEIKIPSIDEQNAIANVLIDMDSEIEELEKKLNKTKLLKQGMMQKLLTGEIRLLK